MDDFKLVSMFKNWAVIGDVTKSEKYASKILRKFKASGYNVYGVHPNGGDEVYKTLKDVPEKIEVIDLCINSKAGIKFLKEAKELSIEYVLIQPGAGSKEIIDFCEENNITAVEGCALIALGKLIL